ncbi:MAG: TIGR02147 family protein [Pseudomonadota bacterium]
MQKSEIFKDFLNDYFSDSKKRDEGLTLRSFAKKLEINPGNLSALMTGRRAFTKSRIEYICERLDITESEKVDIFTPKQTEIDRRELDRSFAEKASNWTYYALLEIIQLKNFVFNPQRVARRLGINRESLTGMLRNMIQVGLVVPTEDGYKPVNKGTQIFAKKTTSQALRRLMLAANRLSRMALENDPIEKRYHAVNTLAIDPRKMEEAKAHLREFREKFCTTMKWSGENAKIYQLNLSFYCLDQDEKREFE